MSQMQAPSEATTASLSTATHEFTRHFLRQTLGGAGAGQQRMVENYLAPVPLPDDPATWRTPVLGRSPRRTSLAPLTPTLPPVSVMTPQHGSGPAAATPRPSRKGSAVSMSLPGSSVFPSFATPKLDMSPLFHPVAWRERRSARRHQTPASATSAIPDDEVESFLARRPCYLCIESSQQPLFVAGGAGGVMVIEQIPVEESIPVFLSKEDAYLYVGHYRFAESYTMEASAWEDLSYAAKLEFCHALLQSSSDVHALQAAGLTGDWARDFELRTDVRQAQVNRLQRLIGARDFDLQFAQCTFEGFDAVLYETLVRRSTRQSIVSTTEDRSSFSDEVAASLHHAEDGHHAPTQASSRRSSRFFLRNVFRRSHDSIPDAAPLSILPLTGKTPRAARLNTQQSPVHRHAPARTTSNETRTPRACRTEPIGGVTPLSFSALQQLDGPGMDGRVAVRAWEAAQHRFATDESADVDGGMAGAGLGLGISGHAIATQTAFREPAADVSIAPDEMPTAEQDEEERPAMQRLATHPESLLSYATYKSMMTEESICSDSFFDEDEALEDDRLQDRFRQQAQVEGGAVRDDWLAAKLAQVATEDSQKHMLQIVRAANGERVFVL